MKKISHLLAPHVRHFIKKHAKKFSVGLFAFSIIFIGFMTLRGTSPSVSELAFTEFSSSKGVYGSLVPASCVSGTHYSHPYDINSNGTIDSGCQPVCASGQTLQTNINYRCAVYQESCSGGDAGSCSGYTTYTAWQGTPPTCTSYASVISTLQQKTVWSCINLPPPTPPALQYFDATSCTIPAGQSDCWTHVWWNITNAVSPRVYLDWNFDWAWTSASGDYWHNFDTPGPGAHTYSAYDTPGTFQTLTVYKSCTAGSVWNGSVCIANDAVCSNVTVPASVTSGQTFSASVTMNNTGGSTWTSAANYNFGSKNPLDNSTWGTGRIGLSSSVAPGGAATFSRTFTAPTAPGAYTFAWGMVQDGVEWFGGTCSQTVNVSAIADLTTGSVSPTSGVEGTAVTLSATISNIGNASTGSSFNNFIQVATAANGSGTVTDLASANMTALGSGASAVTSRSYTFPSPGTYSARACADKSSASNPGTVTESNEGNNCGPWTNVTVIANPTITNVSVNPNYTITFVCNNANSYTATHNETGSLVASGSTTSGATVTVPVTAEGNYTLRCIAGALSAQTIANFTIPAMTFNGISITSSPRTVSTSKNTTVSWSLLNPRGTCSLRAEAVCSGGSASCTQAQTTAVASLNTELQGTTDANDPYGASRNLQTAIKTIAPENNPTGNKALGKKTLLMSYTTDFILDCGGAIVKKLRVVVSDENEG